MKNIILFVAVLLFSISSFAQNKSIDENLTQLMYAKNGLVGVENIATKMSLGVSENNKTTFIAGVENLKTEFMQNALSELKKEFSNADIIAIYNEFTSDKIEYEDRTVNFFAKFRKLKGQYFKSVKELFIANR